MLVVIDSPVTFGLSKVTNQLKFDGTFALSIALTGKPLQISMFVGIDKVTFGCIWTTKELSGPAQPVGNAVGEIVYVTN